MPEERPNITRCMIKRSKLVLRFVVVIGLVYMPSIILGLGSWFVLVIANAMMVDGVLNMFNVVDPFGKWTVLILFIISTIEFFIIGACLSCIPIINKSFKWIFDKADTWGGLKKKETLIFEV